MSPIPGTGKQYLVPSDVLERYYEFKNARPGSLKCAKTGLTKATTGTCNGWAAAHACLAASRACTCHFPLNQEQHRATWSPLRSCRGTMNSGMQDLAASNTSNRAHKRIKCSNDWNMQWVGGRACLLGGFGAGEARDSGAVRVRPAQHKLALPSIEDTVQVRGRRHVSKVNRVALLRAHRPLQVFQRGSSRRLCQRHPRQRCMCRLLETHDICMCMISLMTFRTCRLAWLLRHPVAPKPGLPARRQRCGLCLSL